MKLYGMMASPYVARVVMAARAKGLALEPQPPPGGGIKSPEYLAINPMGKMPALEDKGSCLAESTVIAEYLDEAHPGTPLQPTDPMQRAQARLVARMVDLYVMNQVSVLFRNMNPAQRNQADVDAALTALHKALSDIEHFMGPGPYAVGNALSIADCALLPNLLLVTTVAQGFGVSHLFEGHPKLARWWQHMQSDAVASGVAKDYQAALQAFMAQRRG